ncbi:MAG: SHOCT domain-containing protein [Flammeovirgaceae bacterium]
MNERDEEIAGLQELLINGEITEEEYEMMLL